MMLLLSAVALAQPIWTEAELEAVTLDGATALLPAGEVVVLQHRIPRSFADGEALVVTASTRAQGEAGHRFVRLRQLGPSGQVAATQTEWGAVEGTGAWQEHTLHATLHPRTEVLYIEVYNAQTALETRDWGLSVDGRPWQELDAVRTPGPTGPRDLSKGSGVHARAVSPAETAAVVEIGRVWGFVKYRHPAFLEGHVDWDGVLLDALVALQEGRSSSEVLSGWRTRFAIEPCTDCLTLTADSVGPTDIGWLDALDPPLQTWLREVHRSRGTLEGAIPAGTNGNWTTFPNEARYPEGDTATDPGLRLIGLLRYWTVLADFNVYRDRVPDWPHAVDDLVPRMLDPQLDQAGYERALHDLAARAMDGHAQFFNDFDTVPPVGSCRLPLAFRFVEGAPTVTHSNMPAVAVGDVLVALDDVPVAGQVDTWLTSHPGATRAGKLWSLSLRLGHGPCGPVQATFRRGRKEARVRAERVELPVAQQKRNRPGPALQLEDGVAYLGLGALDADELADVMGQLEGARGLIIDCRDYPAGVWRTLPGYLTRAPYRTHIGAHADPLQPGGLLWNTSSLALRSPRTPHFAGPVAVLADETSFSLGELTVLALQVIERVRVFGESTSGTDGSMTRVAIPGMNEGSFTHNVIYPLHTDHYQQRGIAPDVLVAPTVRDIRDGVDAPYEAARNWILEESRRR